MRRIKLLTPFWDGRKFWDRGIHEFPEGMELPSSAEEVDEDFVVPAERSVPTTTLDEKLRDWPGGTTLKEIGTKSR